MVIEAKTHKLQLKKAISDLNKLGFPVTEKIKEYIDEKYKGKINYYVINSRIESKNKAFVIYSFDKFNGIDMEKMKEFLKEKFGERFNGFDYDEENSMITIELDKTATRKIAEPVIKRFFINE